MRYNEEFYENDYFLQIDHFQKKSGRNYPAGLNKLNRRWAIYSYFIRSVKVMIYTLASVSWLIFIFVG